MVVVIVVIEVVIVVGDAALAARRVDLLVVADADHSVFAAQDDRHVDHILVTLELVEQLQLVRVGGVAGKRANFGGHVRTTSIGLGPRDSDSISDSISNSITDGCVSVAPIEWQAGRRDYSGS